MRNLDIVLPILLGVSIFTIVALAAYIRRKKLRVPPPQVGSKIPLEEFHCVKSSIKEINDSLSIGQFVFTNGIDVLLNKTSKVQRDLSHD
ncbi:MAG: hypothetical protein U0V70_17370 [Terriglobia bacterium]